MTVVLELTELGPADLVAANLAFHVAAGVELVLVPGGLPQGAVGDVLRDHGPVVRSGSTGLPGEGWLLRGSVHELFWPRGPSLPGVLEVVPEAAGAVGALVRQLHATPDDGRPLVERAALRARPSAAPGGGPALRDRTRIVRRLGLPGAVRRAELRGWFPIEVLVLPSETAPSGVDVVEDTRVPDALAAIARGDRPSFCRPTAEEDADFGLEVASLLEAEVVAAGRRIDALERRVAELDQRRLGARSAAALRSAAAAIMARRSAR